MNSPAHTDPRPRRWFWSLIATAVLAMSGLGTALGAPPSPVTGLAVLVAGVVLLAAATQATRIWLALTQPRRVPSPEQPARPMRPRRTVGPRTPHRTG